MSHPDHVKHDGQRARRWRPSRAVLATGLAVPVIALGVIGCGGDDKEDVKKVYNEYTDALKTGDYDAACDKISDKAQKGIVDSAKKVDPKATDCPAALKSLLTAAGVNVGELLKLSKPGEVKVDGDKATMDLTVTVGGQSVKQKVNAVKEDGQWKMESTLGS